MSMNELRLPDDLLRDVEAAAADRGQDPESWASQALQEAVARARRHPDDGSLRDRLRDTGLLIDVAPRDVKRPDPDALRRARAAAGRGRPLADYVSEGRS